ncbi:hypothetical protein evm_014795 [Chilo suppressalis]|nr:hypothetical protein evm_014795 [Chilo suppressalis]
MSFESSDSTDVEPMPDDVLLEFDEQLNTTIGQGLETVKALSLAYLLTYLLGISLNGRVISKEDICDDLRDRVVCTPSFKVSLVREDPGSSPGGGEWSRDSQGTQPSSLSSMLEAQGGLALLGLQKSAGLADPAYMSALYGLGHLDPRQLAAYREVLANKFIGYSGLLSMGAASGPPTTKN